MSTASEPVEMTSIFSPEFPPSFMIEPFPNCFSICWIACSIARDFSVTATFCSLALPKRAAPACFPPAPPRSPPFFPEWLVTSSLFPCVSASRSRRSWAGPVAPRPSFSALFRAALWTSFSHSSFWYRLDPKASVPPSNPAGSFAGPVEHSVTFEARLSRMPARPRRPSARVTTRTGDGGETSLFGKERVRKTDPRIEALGDLDETQAVIGLARSLAPRSSLGRGILELQRGLYLVMAEIATPRSDLARLKERLDSAAVSRLDQLLESLKKQTPIEGHFVIPGENRIAAGLDHARTVARRAERRVVEC